MNVKYRVKMHAGTLKTQTLGPTWATALACGDGDAEWPSASGDGAKESIRLPQLPCRGKEHRARRRPRLRHCGDGYEAQGKGSERDAAKDREDELPRSVRAWRLS